MNPTLSSLVAVLAISSALSAESPPSPRVLIETDLGNIEVELDAARAPLTTANFLKYVDGKFFDHGQVHRTVKPDNQPDSPVKIQVIQGGINPQREKDQFPPIQLERTSQTGLKHRDGTISMARDGPDSATSDFFICIGAQPELDFGGKRNPDGQGFAAFGRVVKGIEIVRKIQAASAEGQTLTPPIRIRQVRRLSAKEGGWINLSEDDGFAAWKPPTGEWFVAGKVGLDPTNPKRLAAEKGSGVIVNGPKGRTNNLLSKQSFGDLELYLEFMVPKGSNSGVKFNGLYEIQIYDSWGVKKPKGSDCGGIYPRAEQEPKYHHIDDGVPPRTNACRPPGEWQTLAVVFRTPRFDAEGKKTAPARFVRVVLNGTLIHEDMDVATPTGSAWRLMKEVPRGPLMLQADHGPVAFRNVRVRPQ